MSQYKNIFVNSEVSKIVLKSIIENKKINFKKLGILGIKKKILLLKKKYYIKKNKNSEINYKYEIFWRMVEEKYNKKVNIVKRSQKQKEKNYNIIYSDFANVVGYLPSLLTLLIFDDQIKKLIKYENFFKDLKILGDFDNISSEQKISFINKIQKGKISIITPLCPDYEHVYIGLGLYKYTFNKLNDGLGLIGKRLIKIINKIHKVLNDYKIPFEHITYYGDFEAYSKEICKRVGSTEKEFISKLKLSSKLIKKSVKEINFAGLLVEELSNKKKWNSLCRKNKKIIQTKLNSDNNFKKLIFDILSSRMDLYKSWYPNLNKKKYINLLIKQGAEYTSMGDLFSEKIKNPVVFGLDHPKMGVFYNINVNIPVLYGKPKYV